MAGRPIEERFQGSLEKLIPGFAGSAAHLGIAVSGGPDSMALLALGHHVWPGRIRAATVDHGLRSESADEAAMVADYCAAQNIPHNVLHPARPITGNLQSGARAARYALLNDWAAQNECLWIATAHHSDDQLETLLLRLARGAGLDGLSGVRAINGNIVRPLLDFRKAELLEYCAVHAIPHVHDPSNANIDFDRVRMRHALESLDMLDAVAANRSARSLADAGTALDWVVMREADAYVLRDGNAVTLGNTDYPTEVLRRLLLHCIALLAPGTQPRGESIMRALAALKAGEKTMIGDILCAGGSVWRFRPAPPRSGEKPRAS
ncbi:tRNA lysidine(34) synthetase TilS [Sphingorhabdus sp. Alg239-R122]|uniref:tRNA lysidine(34) synthetase TilS n=1 Tax=Sphingorhabdus sp. Alg239-R122 TaxID=2305989 RepID=UPI0013DCB8FB|nr:tRNA lysidine(34) synthetase TilS [Sphingorhabdus sp. Alg239-R122]